jgi:hypothetical protein
MTFTHAQQLIAVPNPHHRRTHLLNSLHQKMLVFLAQLLNPVNDLFILLALHGDGDRYPAHDERGTDMVVFRDGLQVRDLEPTRWLLEDFREVLCEESVETFECAESEHPVLGELDGGSGWPKVI